MIKLQGQVQVQVQAPMTQVNGDGMLQLKGGIIMWPLLVALLAALSVIAERVLWWWALKRRTRSDSREAVGCERVPIRSPVAAVDVT